MIDHKAFQEEMEMDHEMVMEMYAVFKEDLLALKQQLQEMGAKDRGALGSVAHGIRGIAVTYHAHELARVAENVEVCLKASPEPDSMAGIERLKQGIAEALDDLDDLLGTE